MQLNARRNLAILLIFAALFVGLQIYFTGRQTDLPLHHWTAGIHLPVFMNAEVLPDWYIYSMPDALWMLALTLSILLIWEFRWSMESLFWYVLAVTVGIAFEIAQVFGLIPGTFDLIDLAFVVTAGLLPILFTITTHGYEKSV